MEIWKSYCDGIYEVSNLGRVRRIGRAISYKDGRSGWIGPRDLRCTVGKNGYKTISMPGRKKALLHRVVADLFCENQHGHYIVNHIDGDKLNNRADNLEWGTYGQNNRHARETGLNQQHGERCNLAKFSNAHIDALRRVNAEYAPSAEKLAELFGMSKVHVYEILRGASRA